MDAGGARSAQPSRGLPPLPSISTVRVPSDPSVLPRRMVSGPKRPQVLSAAPHASSLWTTMFSESRPLLHIEFPILTVQQTTTVRLE